MQRFWPALFVLISACYNPDATSVRYTCDEVNPYCPDGLECISGTCLPPGTQVDLGSTNPPDGSMSVAGCRSGFGFAVGSAFACPGRFDANNTTANIPPASQLCADGYQICANATGIDLIGCKSLAGFFAAQVQVRRNDKDPPQCGAPGGGRNNRLFAGCGRTTPTDRIFDITQQMCSGFIQALDCATEDWNCNGSVNTLDRAENALLPNDGVLCCKS